MLQSKYSQVWPINLLDIQQITLCFYRVTPVGKGQDSCHSACLLPALSTSINSTITDIKGHMKMFEEEKVSAALKRQFSRTETRKAQGEALYIYHLVIIIKTIAAKS